MPGAPSAKIQPVGTTPAYGICVYERQKRIRLPVVNNDDGALAYENLHLFQTYSSVTGVPMGYEEDPNDQPRDPSDPEIRAIRRSEQSG